MQSSAKQRTHVPEHQTKWDHSKGPRGGNPNSDSLASQSPPRPSIATCHEREQRSFLNEISTMIYLSTCCNRNIRRKNGAINNTRRLAAHPPLLRRRPERSARRVTRRTSLSISRRSMRSTGPRSSSNWPDARVMEHKAAGALAACDHQPARWILHMIMIHAVNTIATIATTAAWITLARLPWSFPQR